MRRILYFKKKEVKLNDFLIIGAFDFLTKDTGGQPVKTRNLFYAFVEEFGADNVSYIDTFRWKRNPFVFFIRLIKCIRNSRIIIFLPAHNGFKTIAKTVILAKKRRTKVYYDVVGGWLPKALKEDRKAVKCLSKLDGIWVETKTMQKALSLLGLSNTAIVPNFKNHQITVSDGLLSDRYPIRLCTFSRVMREKGIELAINSVLSINKETNNAFLLDIYGPIDVNFKEDFHKLINNCEFVNYKGVISPDICLGQLSSYHALLFPTLFYTEGIPGTVIDALFAGLPVVCSKWESYSDVLTDGVNSIGYDFDDRNGLINSLNWVYEHPNELLNMKKNCYLSAEQYSKKTAIKLIKEMMLK